MKHAALYEEFDASASETPAAIPVSLEDGLNRSQAAYDKGYSCGWEDATAALKKRGESISIELERAIQDMGFTYHEAVGQVRREFMRFVDQLIQTFLPSLTAEGLRDTLSARIEALSEPLAEPHVEIFVPPHFVDVFQPLVEKHASFPVSILSEASLSDAQAFARIGQTELSVDFGPLLQAMEEAMQESGDSALKEALND